MAVWILYVLVFVLAVAGIALASRVEALRGRVRQLEEMLAWDERTCRVCGCTDEVACLTGCWWEEDDLCSSCADDRASSLEGQG